MATATPELRHIPLKQIRQNPVALREVDKTKEKYKGIVDSIRERGVLNPINVRQVSDGSDGNEPIYSLIDGLHRYTASIDAGKDTIPAQVLSMEDGQVEEAQIIANFHKVETKPFEFANQLNRVLARNPLLTKAELAARVNMGEQWLDQILNLKKLEPKIGGLVDEGKISAANAIALSKLPPELQSTYIDRAMTLQSTEFVPQVTQHVKELRAAARQGRNPNLEYQAVPHLRKPKEIKEAVANENVAREMCGNLQTPVQGFMAALNWALHLDDASVKAGREAFDARKKKDAEDKAKREADRTAKKAAEAAAKQAELQKQLQPT